MNVVKTIAMLIWSIGIPISALAGVTKIVNSPEVVLPRIHARSYDVKFGIAYSDPGLDGKKGPGPLFGIERHKVKSTEGTRAVLGVEIPKNATLVQVRGLMHNEPWGGSQHPPKANTDDLGSIDNMSCPMGKGDCPIAWADVSAYIDALNPDGKRFITAVFRNWAGRNDRTGVLEVTYTVPD